MRQKLESETKENKAGYTATEVACGWAGAIFEVTRPFRQQQWGQRSKIIKESKMGTNQPTNQPTDGRTKRVVESRARDLKSLKLIDFLLKHGKKLLILTTGSHSSKALN